MKKQTKKTLWRGLTSTSAVLMVVSLFGTQCAITYTGTLNSYLGTTTSRIVSTGDPSAEDTNYYTSEFGDYSAENLQKLIQATYDESVLEQEEGSVLLRNNNSALPLSPNSHVTLFGHAVVQPVYAPGVCPRWCKQRRSVHRYICNRSVSGVEGCRFLYQ